WGGRARGFGPTRANRGSPPRNHDVEIVVQAPKPSEEKRRLFARYLRARHDGSMDPSKENFEAFLYPSPRPRGELGFRRGKRLLGAGMADLEPRALSAVYFYFEPEEERRSPGV